jgi:hypothetical protein
VRQRRQADAARSSIWIEQRRHERLRQNEAKRQPDQEHESSADRR